MERALIRRKIEGLKITWHRCSQNRKRDAFLVYLKAVLRLYRQLKKNLGIKKSGARMANIYKVNLRDDMHPVRCIIEVTSHTGAQNKNRMTQALRYALKQRWREDVIDKIRENGGIKGCADKFGKINKGARYSRSKKKVRLKASGERVTAPGTGLN
jgi:hypothetical protein